MGIFEDAARLSPGEKAKLVDTLLSSLDVPDEDVDREWAREAESRIDAHERGDLRSVSLEEVLEKYR